MSIHQDEFPPQIPPEEEACLRIIFDYQRGHLTLEEAAPRLREAFRGVRGGMNLEISPKIRRLFAEVARLDGRSFPLTGPDPNRHADGGQAIAPGPGTEGLASCQQSSPCQR